MMASARARFSTAELANLLMQTHHGSLLQSKYKEDTVLVIVADMWPELPDELNHTSKNSRVNSVFVNSESEL